MPTIERLRSMRLTPVISDVPELLEERIQLLRQVQHMGDLLGEAVQYLDGHGGGAGELAQTIREVLE